MSSKNNLGQMFNEAGFTDYKWLDPKDIVIAQWVRMKCMFGCDEYGLCAMCPPNAPSIEECRSFFDEYSKIAVFRFTKSVAKPEDRKKWSKSVTKEMSKLERKIFLAGYHKVFMLPMDSCSICADCVSDKKDCKNPKSARPTPEALGVSVFDTVRKIGYPIEVLKDYSDEMNRYTFLLIE